MSNYIDYAVAHTLKGNGGPEKTLLLMLPPFSRVREGCLFRLIDEYYFVSSSTTVTKGSADACLIEDMAVQNRITIWKPDRFYNMVEIEWPKEDEDAE